MPNKNQHKIWVEINKNNLLHNVNIIRKIIGKKTILMAVIKSNAYGHGILEIAGILSVFPNIFFAVDSIEEAFRIRKAGIKNQIMILGYILPARLKEAAKNKFHFSVYSKEVLKRVAKISKNGKIRPNIHLKIETGTNRLGLRLEELKSIKNLPPITGIYTHFAEVENTKSSFYKEQLEQLKKAELYLNKIGRAPKFIHSACSAAILQYPETHSNLARLGIALYGLWPDPEIKKRLSKKITLKSVLSWKTRIAQIKNVNRGETASYNRTYKFEKSGKIAILPIGYYDGFDRGFSNKGEVLINGKKAPVRGRVCMNMTIADLNNIQAVINDEVVLIGKSEKNEIAAEELAEKIGTINYEVVTRINPLMPRIII